MSAILNVVDVEKYYGIKCNLKKALDQVRFKIESGEFVSIMGPSGSGKTTLLNCISTIDTVSAGNIYLGDQDLTLLSPERMAQFRKKNLGFIFQNFNLLNTLSIEENIALPLAISNIPAKEIHQRVQMLMQRLGITDIADKFPYQVSGGQQQRCACARAFVNRPKLILADEPTGALDSASSCQLLTLLTQLSIKEQATILMVTHDPFAASYGNRVLFLKDGCVNKEIYRRTLERNEFYHMILAEISILGDEEEC